MTDGDGEGAALPPAFRFFNETAIIDQLASRAFEDALGEDLTVPQFSVLNHLLRVAPRSSPQRLARAFQVAKSAMTKTLGHLAAKGLVAVTPDPEDGRAKLVEITPAGRAAHRAAVAALGPTLEALTREVPIEEMEAALPTLERVRRWLDARRD